MVNPADTSIRSICFLRTTASQDAGALERALRLCQRTSAELCIVSVVDPLPEPVARLMAACGAPLDEVMGETEEAAEGDRLVELARQRGVRAASVLLRGKRFLEVSRKVLRDKHDLLVKAAEPTQAIQRVLLGHTDRQLIRKCPCTVWIEKPSDGKTHDRILAAVDPTPFQDDPDINPMREALNARILYFGQLLARIEEAELHVAHAWTFEWEQTLRSRGGVEEEVIARVGESLRQKHETALSELLEPYMPEIERVHLVRGHAGEEIARIAARLSIDVIVMGTLCRSGLGGLLIGNTAETVLDHVNCSIVALKPAGFVSPIQP